MRRSPRAKEASETSQRLLEYDEALATALSVKDHVADEVEIEGVVREFYPEVAEEEAITVEATEDTPAKGDAVSADQPTEEQEAGDLSGKNVEAIEVLFEANEEAQRERDKKEPPPPAKEPQETLDLFT